MLKKIAIYFEPLAQKNKTNKKIVDGLYYKYKKIYLQ